MEAGYRVGADEAEILFEPVPGTIRRGWVAAIVWACLALSLGVASATRHVQRLTCSREPRSCKVEDVALRARKTIFLADPASVLQQSGATLLVIGAGGDPYSRPELPNEEIAAKIWAFRGSEMERLEESWGRGPITLLSVAALGALLLCVHELTRPRARFLLQKKQRTLRVSFPRLLGAPIAAELPIEAIQSVTIVVAGPARRSLALDLGEAGRLPLGRPSASDGLEDARDAIRRMLVL